jgi:hypothetical protein
MKQHKVGIRNKIPCFWNMAKSRLWTEAVFGLVNIAAGKLCKVGFSKVFVSILFVSSHVPVIPLFSVDRGSNVKAVVTYRGGAHETAVTKQLLPGVL